MTAPARSLPRLLLTIATCFVALAMSADDLRPDTLWFRADDRFQENKAIPLVGYDTIVFSTIRMNLLSSDPTVAPGKASYNTATPGVFLFSNPGRILYKPASMPGDYTKSSSHWCFERSRESEHYVCFWEKGVEADVDAMLAIGERCWDVYTRRLGFVTPGHSSTDKYKIIMRVYNSSDWIASGSGEDMKVGTFNVSPQAVGSRGGATVAHEIGHTFQYLTNVDCGANNTHGFNYGLGENGAGGNGFWEDCANWMAYKVYPERQFTDGEYFEGYLARCHQNLMHEDSRYYNCYYQDYLCERFGEDFIGRLWRESINPEDPVDAIMRLQNLSTDDFSALMYDCFARMCTWDVEAIRDAARHRIGAHGCYLHARAIDGEEWFQVDSAHCPQNYGYNITALKVPAAGTTLTLTLASAVGEAGYRAVSRARAGWRWGVVALMDDGSTRYGTMQDGEGTTTYVVPEGTERLWLVVMGAPTRWWHHAWDDNSSNDEQWPYRVRLQGTRPNGIFRTYTADDFPADYVRHDTTITVHCTLPYSGSSYSSVRVQYDMDAVSEALGLTTAQLHALGSGASRNPRFVGVSAGGAVTEGTTTTTSSATCLGHWFSTAGNVCGYDGSAAIYAEMYPADFSCNVGQYPGRLRAGRSYTVRQGIYYKVGTRTYKATIAVVIDVL